MVNVRIKDSSRGPRVSPAVSAIPFSRRRILRLCPCLTACSVDISSYSEVLRRVAVEMLRSYLLEKRFETRGDTGE